MMRAKDFFNEEEKRRVGEAVVAAESVTAGEIALMVVDRSNRYLEAQILGAFLIAGLLSLAAAFATAHLMVWAYVPMVVLFFYPAKGLMAACPGLLIPLVGKGRVEEAVRQRAIRAFYEKGLHRVGNEAGILIFVSLLEHKVWILRDRGINGKTSSQSWHELAGEIAEGIRENRACETLCRVISRCGNILKDHFPQDME